MKERINKLLVDFLLELIGTNPWSEAVVNIELQPGMLGVNGYYLDEHSKKNHLRTRPSEKLKEAIKEFHRETARDELSKWNRYKLKVSQNLIMETEFIWDEKWQQDIDQLNREIRNNNPSSILPRWHWEKEV